MSVGTEHCSVPTYGVRVVRLLSFMNYFLIFIFGLAIGSFLNLVICRLKTKETILSGRSHCPKCGTVLKWFDLIPVLSFVFSLGKCRYCGKRISYQYPIVELATGLLFALIFFYFKNTIDILYYSTIISLLIVIFAYDLKHYIIPDKIVFPGMIIALFYQVLNNNLYYPILAGLLASGFFLFLVLITKGKGMGLGDVKLAGLMGLVLSWPNILIALFLSFLFGAVIGIILIIGKRKKLKSQVPFGPFLVGSTIITMFCSCFLISLLIKLS